jgi:hypothetical protein
MGGLDIFKKNSIISPLNVMKSSIDDPVLDFDIENIRNMIPDVNPRF